MRYLVAVLFCSLIGITPAAAQVFAADTFAGSDGTNLTSHAADVCGANWLHNASAIGLNYTINNNRAYQFTSDGGNGYNMYLPCAPASADYQVQASFAVLTVIANNYVGIEGRKSATVGTQYGWVHNGGSNEMELTAFVSGSGGTIAATAVGFSAGNSYLGKLVMNGTTITGYINGAVLNSVTNTSIAPAGYSGLGGYVPAAAPSSTTGVHIDNFEASGFLTGGCKALLLGIC